MSRNNMRTMTRLLLILWVAAGSDLRAQERLPLRTLDVVVTNEAGAPVTTLTRDSFTLLEETEVRDIHSFGAPDTPWNIVLLLDRAVTQAQTEGIERFIARLKPNDRITIAMYSDQVETVMDWKDRTAKVPALKVTPGVNGATKDLHATVRWAMEKLSGRAGRKAAIFVTDGHDRRLAPQWLVNDGKEEILDPLFGLADLSEAEDFRRLHADVVSRRNRVS